MTLSNRQIEVLRIIARKDGQLEWGDVHSSLNMSRHGALEMSNFQRIADALERRGMIVYTDGGLLTVTPAGRAALGVG